MLVENVQDDCAWYLNVGSAVQFKPVVGTCDWTTLLLLSRCHKSGVASNEQYLTIVVYLS